MTGMPTPAPEPGGGSSGQEAGAAGPAVTPPVVMGPVSVGAIGGIPVLGITGPIRQYSGRRLSAMIMAAMKTAGLTIDVPDV